ncbi:MAG: hypothetical protein QXY70_01350 [Nanopusillaceae archaeon]
MDIGELLKDPQELDYLFERAILLKDKKLAEILYPYIESPSLLLDYAYLKNQPLDERGESIIAQDPQKSYHYAKYILKGPFPKGEDTIAQSFEWGYKYALDVLQGPFPKGEDAISQNAWSSYFYASLVLKGPFPKGEDAIAKDPNLSYKYAKDVLRDRFIKGEKVIISDEESLSSYIDFLKSIGKLEEFYNDYPELRK